MNDVVFEYDLKVTECQAEKWFEAGQGYKEGLKLTLDIRAKGGRYPIKLGVVLGGLDKKYIETVATRILLKERTRKRNRTCYWGNESRNASTATLWKIAIL